MDRKQVVELLRQQADEIARDGHAGWGNTMNAAADLLEAQQAKIDRLMLEHCPGEMTPEQVAEWGKHQRPLPEGPGHE